MIHPTAIIDSSAKIGSDTEIGAYTVIGPGVEIGAHCVIANHVSIAGPTKIGDGNTFFPYCSVGQRTQDNRAVPTIEHVHSRTHDRAGGATEVAITPAERSADIWL